MRTFHVQPCWSCRKCYGSCEWSKKDPRPIPGWEATPTVKKHSTQAKVHLDRSFAIHYCPEYEWDGTEVGYGG